VTTPNQPPQINVRPATPAAPRIETHAATPARLTVTRVRLPFGDVFLLTLQTMIATAIITAACWAIVLGVWFILSRIPR
jgi:hypothetical protein